MAKDVINPLPWMTKVVGPASSSFKSNGACCSNDSANIMTVSSEDIPPPPPLARGCNDRIAAIKDNDSLVLKVTLALVCIPNTSGSSVVVDREEG